MDDVNNDYIIISKNVITLDFLIINTSKCDAGIMGVTVNSQIN